MYGRFEYYGAPDIDREMRLEEARSTAVKDKPGKYKYQGKVGVWRTLPNGDKVFFPDDKSGPMAMRGPTKEKGKKPGLLKRIGGAIKKAFTREELEAELARLESTSSPFPEVRERRIAELKAELTEIE
jgi:hypothetical protein